MSMQNPITSNILGSAISSALETARMNTDIENTKADTAVKNAAEKVTNAQLDLTKNSAKSAEAQAKLAQAAVPAAENRANIEKTAFGKYVLGPLDAILPRIGEAIGGITSARKLFLGGKGGTDTIRTINAADGEILNETKTRRK